MAYARIHSRHIEIVEFIRNRRKPSVADILSHLHGLGETVTARTVQRDIKEISDQLDIEITRKGTHPDHWYEVTSEPDERPIQCSYLHHALMADIMKAELVGKREQDEVIHPDRPIVTAGINHIPLIVKSIRELRMVRITHKKFDDEPIARIVCPLFIREFRKRWYLIARDGMDGVSKTFGIDRITKVEQLTDTFSMRENENFQSIFGHVIGLFGSDENPIEITFWSETYHANYLRTLPLHASQIELSQVKDGAVFQLTVVPNFEFIQTMLMMGDRVRVLSPDSVRAELAASLRTTLGYYS